MALEKYNEKRRFDETPEPEGKLAKNAGKRRFVVQKHEATRLHYDFRLEIAGVLVSWAVPKGPSLKAGERRLAMMTEDHPMAYRDFEGIIPEDNYGAGTVMVWDEGTFEPVPWDGKKEVELKTRAAEDKFMRERVDKGHLTFILQGHKINGEFALIKLHNSKDENAWLLVKADKDEFVTDRDVTKQDKSVISGRIMKEIAAEADTEWTRGGKVDYSKAPKGKFPVELRPMLATLTDAAFDDDNWVFEVKWDGYRILAHVKNGKTTLKSRNLQNYTDKYAPVAAELDKLAKDAVFDGEMVVVDGSGHSKFNLLQNYHETGEGNLVYYVFDVLHYAGHDLTELPLLERKQILQAALPDSELVKYSDHIAESGKSFFEIAKKEELEGIMAKRADSRYEVGRRSKAWLKVKVHKRQEVVVGGFTEPQGGRKGVGALILGVFGTDGLEFVGHSGGAFGGISPEDLRPVLDKLEIQHCPFVQIPKSSTKQHWVKPTLVAEVEFTEWTGDGSMRHPNIVGWREDKPASTVVRERPVANSNNQESNDKQASTSTSQVPNSGDANVTVGKHRLQLTNLSKTLWPQEGYTKSDLINYYREIAPIILPYLKDRPENMNRHPNGIEAPGFYQKDIGDQGPDWLKRAKIYSDSNERDLTYLVCNDEATLVYMANLGCIEINPWNSREPKNDKPDWCVIDLDPEGKITFGQVVQVAREVHAVCEAAGIPHYPKTSGKTGIHIYIPLGAKYNYDQSRDFAHVIGQIVNARLPKITSLERKPEKRQHRIYLDYLQNRHGQTLAAPYSVRPAPAAPVSTPLMWDEVNSKLDPTKFTVKTIFKRLDKKGDLWEPVTGKGIDLKKALKGLEGLLG